jgi:cytochrome b6
METVIEKPRARIRAWLEERLPLQSWQQFLGKKEVPIHRHMLWYYFGGMTLFLFGVQVVTGILLLLYYRPSAEHAFESVQFIMAEVRFGWLIRSIHSWSANLMIATLFIHMFSVFLLKAYRPPRELTWITGVLLMFVALAFGFSGYLLPWNKLAYFATKVGSDIAGAVPLIGSFLLRFLRGGDDVTGATLTRLFGVHVAILPAITTLVLVTHLLFVQIQGMSVPIGVASNRAMKFIPYFLLRDLLGWLVALAALAALAALFPWELGEKADPFAPAPAGIRPEWYYLFMFQTLKYIPNHILFIEGEVVGVVAFMLGAVFWLLVPFLDRRSAAGQRSPVFTGIGIAVIVYMAVMTLLALVPWRVGK